MPEIFHPLTVTISAAPRPMDETRGLVHLNTPDWSTEAGDEIAHWDSHSPPRGRARRPGCRVAHPPHARHERCRHGRHGAALLGDARAGRTGVFGAGHGD